MSITEDQINYNDLLNQAISGKGTLSKCFSMFHNYSIHNQVIAMYQMNMMNLSITPLNTYNGWNRLGRKVKKGSKAISLWMPTGGYSVKVTNENGEEETKFLPTRFILKNQWFCMDQTSGAEVKANELKTNIKFDFFNVYKKFNIKLVKFEHINGNVQGYADVAKKELAINPMADHPEMTVLHEVAHIALKHNEVKIEKEIKEVEAETVAYIVGSLIGLSEQELSDSRGYIQNWLGNNKISDKTCKRIFKVADAIIKAGKVE